VADASLVAADAARDRLAGTRPPREVGVGDLGPRHPDGIAHALGDQAVGVGRVEDAPGGDHGDGRPRLYGPCELRDGVRRRRRRRHDPCRAPVRRRRAERDRDVVGEPVRTDGFGRGEDVVEVGADGRGALVGQAAADGPVWAEPLTHRLEHLAQEAEPVLEAPAVLIRADVGVPGEELGRQVAEAGAHLDAVEAALGRVGGRLPVALEHLADLGSGERARLRLEPGRRDRARRHGGRPRPRGDHLASAVEELADQPRPVLLHGGAHPLPHGHDLGQVAADGVRGQEARGVDGRRLDDDQPRAACRAGAVVGDQVVGRQVVVDERRLVRR
jgi:hypothetical protein